MDYKTIGIVVAILFGIALLIGLIIYLKPYFIKHDTTILFTGGLGSGKTLESVKRAIVLIRKNRFFKWKIGNFKISIKNAIIRSQNKARVRKYKKLISKGLTPEEAVKKAKPIRPQIKKIQKPLMYSNIPIQFKPHLFATKKEWSRKLTVDHILLLDNIREYSVVVIDEFPQFISQFDWDIELVQKNCNEFITFFRHYIGGHLIINAQSEDEIECHFRRKLNIGVWCFDFHIWPAPFLPLFYTNRMCDFMLSENVQTMSTTYIEENTKIHFGLFPRKAYDSRCYKPRYDKVHKLNKCERWDRLQTKEVLRLRPYISPLDTKTTEAQIEEMQRKANKLKRNEDDKQ